MTQPVTPTSRDDSLDMLRGLIIALMALDHVRIFFTSATFEPTNTSQTTAAYFVIRWVTHLCAPGFYFLAGIASSMLEEKVGKRPLSQFLVARGSMLICLEIIVFGLAWSFNPGWWWFGVIAGLGAAMIALAGLIYLPRKVTAVAALLLIFFGDAVMMSHRGGGTATALLYTGGPAHLAGLGDRMVLYPLLPWLALMALGYALGPWLSRRDAKSIRQQALLAAGALVLFVVLRFTDWGQPAFASGAKFLSVSPIFEFFNVKKYPPSVEFSLVTLGIDVLILAGVRRYDLSRKLSAAPLLAFGRVPFFFYAIHLFLIHGLALAVALLLHWPTAYVFWNEPRPNLVPPPGYGFGPAGVLAIWLMVLAFLWPACDRFARYKRAHSSWWLRLF